MASNAPNLGGYSCKFVTEPPDSYICKICNKVAKDPQQMDCCGKVYCGLCLTEHMKHSNKCPQCRKESSSFNDKRGKKINLICCFLSITAAYAHTASYRRYDNS